MSRAKRTDERGGANTGGDIFTIKSSSGAPRQSKLVTQLIFGAWLSSGWFPRNDFQAAAVTGVISEPFQAAGSFAPEGRNPGGSVPHTARYRSGHSHG